MSADLSAKPYVAVVEDDESPGRCLPRLLAAIDEAIRASSFQDKPSRPLRLLQRVLRSRPEENLAPIMKDGTIYRNTT